MTKGRAAALIALALIAGCGGSSSSGTVQVHGIVLGGPNAPACADFYQGGRVAAISLSGKTLAHATLHRTSKLQRAWHPPLTYMTSLSPCLAA
jgi:hypothetical protein